VCAVPFDVGEEEMLRRISSRRAPAARAAAIFLAVFAGIMFVSALTMALEGQSDKPAKPDKNATTRLRIEVTTNTGWSLSTRLRPRAT